MWADVSTWPAIRIAVLLLGWRGAASAQDLRDQTQIDQLLRMVDAGEAPGGGVTCAGPNRARRTHTAANRRSGERFAIDLQLPLLDCSGRFIDFAPVWRSKTVTSGMPGRQESILDWGKPSDLLTMHDPGAICALNG